jgi:large subunit ribosomal protein L15
MQIHNIKKNKANKTSIKVGRGGKRGKTSGKGHKGQNARAGNSGRPEIRDMIKKLPKLRGYRFNSIQENYVPVNLKRLEESFKNGEKVTPKTLLSKKVINRKSGKTPKVKILGTGDITKKIKISGCKISKTAKEKIEKAGGEVK